MKDSTKDFKKSKSFLVCIDSDGCAMDTMEVKHRKCFAPKAVEVWQLQAIEEKFLKVWNDVNLYSKTRGINRFKGLVKTFELLKEEGVEVPEFEDILEWTNTSKELSNPAIERKIIATGNEQLVKTLEWSKEVNKAITELPEEDKPFPNVKRGLEIIEKVADIAIVSSANGSAVNNEWTRHGLADHVQVLLGQEAGTKAACIAELKEKNYQEDEVLMVGDALSDLDSAACNGVLFYPIIVGKEESSWKRLVVEALPKLLKGEYRGRYQQDVIDELKAVLK